MRALSIGIVKWEMHCNWIYPIKPSKHLLIEQLGYFTQQKRMVVGFVASLRLEWHTVSSEKCIASANCCRKCRTTKAWKRGGIFHWGAERIVFTDWLIHVIWDKQTNFEHPLELKWAFVERPSCCMNIAAYSGYSVTYSYWTNFLWYVTGVYKSTLAKILYLIFSFLNAWFLWYPVDKSWSEKIIVLVLENAWVKIFRNSFLFVSAFQRCIPPCSLLRQAPSLRRMLGQRRHPAWWPKIAEVTAFKTAMLCALGNDIDPGT